MPHVNVRFDEDTLIRVDEIRGECSRSDFVKEAVARLVDERFWKREKVQEAIAAIDCGDVHTAEDVKQAVRGLGYRVE